MYITYLTDITLVPTTEEEEEEEEDDDEQDFPCPLASVIPTAESGQVYVNSNESPCQGMLVTYIGAPKSLMTCGR